MLKITLAMLMHYVVAEFFKRRKMEWTTFLSRLALLPGRRERTETTETIYIQAMIATKTHGCSGCRLSGGDKTTNHTQWQASTLYSCLARRSKGEVRLIWSFFVLFRRLSCQSFMKTGLSLTTRHFFLPMRFGE